MHEGGLGLWKLTACTVQYNLTAHTINSMQRCLRSLVIVLWNIRCVYTHIYAYINIVFLDTHTQITIILKADRFLKKKHLQPTQLYQYKKTPMFRPGLRMVGELVVYDIRDNIQVKPDGDLFRLLEKQALLLRVSV